SLLWNAMRVLLSNGETELLRGNYELAAELSSRTRDAGLALFQPRLDAIFATLEGRLEDAIQFGDRVLTLGVELGRPVAARQYGTQDALRARIWLGRTEEALAGFASIRESLGERADI